MKIITCLAKDFEKCKGMNKCKLVSFVLNICYMKNGIRKFWNCHLTVESVMCGNWENYSSRRPNNLLSLHRLMWDLYKDLYKSKLPGFI